MLEVRLKLAKEEASLRHGWLLSFDPALLEGPQRRIESMRTSDGVSFQKLTQMSPKLISMRSFRNNASTVEIEPFLCLISNVFSSRR